VRRNDEQTPVINVLLPILLPVIGTLVVLVRSDYPFVARLAGCLAMIAAGIFVGWKRVKDLYSK
jgi:hypothetical protein